VVEYLGTRYAGFQRQPGELTVQQVLEEAIGAITQEDVRTTGSGRTDAGTHALGQVFTFATDSPLPAETLRRAVNARLPYDISLKHAEDTDETFHPRHSARSRHYRYMIWNRPSRSPFWSDRATHIPVPLDHHLMHEACQLLVGSHDFSSFVPIHLDVDRTRTITRAQCAREGDVVSIDLEGNSFMRQMIRSIAGTLIRVGLRKVSVSEFADVLESKTRTEAADTAPAHGLYLVEVRYAQPLEADNDYEKAPREARVKETV
jgi:tRNA pseudouridine38-40 synthase